MINLFKVTYVLYFESDKNSKHHRAERFYIWKAPSLLSFISKTKEQIEKENNCNLVLVFCGKF